MALTDALKALADNPDELTRLRHAARARAAERFTTPDQTAEQQPACPTA